MRSLKPLRAGLAFTFAAFALATADAGFAPPGVRQLTVGKLPPGGVDGVDAGRTRRSPWPLPLRPAVVWRGQIPGGVLGAVSDGSGNVVAATLNGSLVEIDRRGRVKWGVALPALAAGSPAVAAGGRRWLVTRNGQIHAFSPSGRLLIREPLEPGPNIGRAQVLPLSNSELLVTQSTHVRWLTSQGQLAASMILETPILESYESQGRVYLIDNHGSVYAWSGTHKPREVQTLDNLRGAPVLAPNGSWLWYDGQRIAMSSKSQGPKVWFALGSREPSAGLALTGSGLVLTPGGNAVARGSTDGQFQRITLGSASRNSVAPLPPLGDPRGNAAVVDGLGRLVMIDRTGAVQPTEGASCAEPVCVVPLGPEQIALVCASGAVAGIGELR